MSLHRKLSDRSVLAAMSIYGAAVGRIILQARGALAISGCIAGFDGLYCGSLVFMGLESEANSRAGV